MFREIVTPTPSTPPASQNVFNNIDSLFLYHPLHLSAIVETVWLNRSNASTPQTGSPFLPWPPQIAYNILSTTSSPGYTFSPAAVPIPMTTLSGGPFIAPLNQPGLIGTSPDGQTSLSTVQYTNWDHLIYAYLVENTRIYQIFAKVLETYMYTEELETPSPASQIFWRNVEFLIFGDAVPSMVWTTTSRLRRDEVANRLTAYYWMFGIDLSHASELAGHHPYTKPTASNRDFIPTFEAMAREVWRGIVNSRNTSGPNDTDPTVIATLARRIYDMMQTRRLNGNLSREEFRAVAVMSFLNLAIMYDSPAVVDLKATASSPEMRLQKIAERVGMNAHPKTKPLLDLAFPFSQLLQAIETGAFNNAFPTATQPGAQILYLPTIPPANTLPNPTASIAETVIDQYTLATGRDLKALPVSVVPRATTSALPPSRRPPSRPPLPPPAAHPRAATLPTA